MKNKLLEAARQIVYFDGPTEENLKALRREVNEADNGLRFFFQDDDDEGDEEEEGEDRDEETARGEDDEKR